ncbi:MAG: dihydropteroate synthase [Dehalococcoidia bacterium]|nr:dihydropteroate synthase [Dehalococcoidia bacterium]
MAVINVTPDSFSGDGVTSVEQALRLAERFAAAGADFVDIGGESTRPGSDPLGRQQELERVLPVVEAIAARIDIPLSIDTYKEPVARAALDAGADIVNDIWGFRHDEAMAPLCAERTAPAVVMHNQRGRPHGDVVGDVLAGWRESLDRARSAGLDEELVILDPGFGFGWEVDENLEMLARLGELRVAGRPILLGTSRKSTLGAITGRPVEGRLAATAATVALAITAGADIVRVHDVEFMADVCRMADAVARHRA